MAASTSPSIIPIFTSRGDVAAFLTYPHLYNGSGEWVGWVTPSRDVYSVLGFYVGFLTDDPRILRKRSDTSRPRKAPPPPAHRILVPSRVPLAHLMSELTHDLVDILMEEPEKLHTLDSGELRDDMG